MKIYYVSLAVGLISSAGCGSGAATGSNRVTGGRGGNVDGAAGGDSAGGTSATGGAAAAAAGIPCGSKPLAITVDGQLSTPECGLDGAWHWYADAAGTSVKDLQPGQVPYRSGRGMCLAGHVLRDVTYAAWGAGVGFLPRAWAGVQVPWNAAASDVIGFEVTITGTTGLADLRMFADHRSARPAQESAPFVTLDGPGTHRVLLGDFRVPESWTPNGGERLDPTQIRYLNFQVAGGDVESDFDFCVADVSPLVTDLIDDLEDGDDVIASTDGRDGSWFPYGDGTGVQTPALGHMNSPGGYGGGRAAATQGSGFTQWGAGIGFALRWDGASSRPVAYDASRYAGVRLRVRGTSATQTLRVLPITRAVATVENGGTCASDCVDPHFWVVPLADGWVEHVLPFTHLFQNGVRPADFDPAQLLGLNFQVSPGGAFDFALDDVAFYRSAAPRPDPDPGIRITLDPRTDPLLSAGFQGLQGFPDQPVLRLDLGTTQRFWLTAWPEYGHGYPSSNADPTLTREPTFALDVPGLTALGSATPQEVLAPGPSGSFDNGYAGLGGLYRHADGRLYGFYHAEDWQTADGSPTPRMPDTNGVPGFYASVAAAVSDDDGLHWTKLGQVLTGSLPKQWPASAAEAPAYYDQGVCGPGAVVDRTGRYLLLYYTDNSRRDGRTNQLSLARADLREGPPGPGRFQKYYLGRFGEPGLAGLESPLPGRRAYLVNPTHTYGHPVWSEHLQRYVMVLNVGQWDAAVGDLDPTQSGIYVMFSQDGIYWSAPRRLVSDYVYFKSGRSFSYMAQLLFDDATGASGWLVYAHSDAWGSPLHYLVGHRISLALP